MDMNDELIELQQSSTLQQSTIESLIGQLQLQIMQQSKYIVLLENRIKELLSTKGAVFDE